MTFQRREAKLFQDVIMVPIHSAPKRIAAQIAVTGDQRRRQFRVVTFAQHKDVAPPSGLKLFICHAGSVAWRERARNRYKSALVNPLCAVAVLCAGSAQVHGPGHATPPRRMVAAAVQSPEQPIPLPSAFPRPVRHGYTTGHSNHDRN
jgi:hypothetical protein